MQGRHPSRNRGHLLIRSISRPICNHHRAASWWLQIQRTDLDDFFAKERIGTVQPKLEPLRLPRRCRAGRRYDLGPAYGIDATRPARPRRIGQGSPNVLADATSRKAPPPARHRIGIDAQLPRALGRGPLCVRKQRNPSAALLCERAAMGVQQCLDRLALGLAQMNRSGQPHLLLVSGIRLLRQIFRTTFGTDS